jgi:hypothetical protein
MLGSHRTIGVIFLATALLGSVGCAPGDDEDSTEGTSDLKSGGKTAACPTDARLSQGFSGKHDGVDLANKRGTTIFAVAAGKVTASGPASGYGQWIRIQHDDGSMTEYGHMFQRDVQVGARVTAGQRIALMGSEGRSTGSHLHLRTYKSASRVGSGAGMNPVEYLRARGISLPCKPGTVSGQTQTPDQQANNGGVESSGLDGDEDPETSFDVSGVIPWKAADIHAEESTDSPVLGRVEAKKKYDATCWVVGERVNSDGYSTDRWVEVADGDVVGFVNGVFLKGNETGGVTQQCR